MRRAAGRIVGRRRGWPTPAGATGLGRRSPEAGTKSLPWAYAALTQASYGGDVLRDVLRLTPTFPQVLVLLVVIAGLEYGALAWALAGALT